MNNSLAEVIFRAIQLLSGVAPEKHTGFLLDSQWWSNEQITALQSARFAPFLGYLRNSSYYSRRVLNQLGHPSDQAEIHEFLKNAPVLTKEILREKFPEIRSESRLGKRISLSTSGSTGIPLHLEIDRKAFSIHFAAKLRALSWYGVRFSDRQLRVWGLTSKQPHRVLWQIRDGLQNRFRLVTFDMSDSVLERVARRCDRFRPTYINGYSSGINRFAEFLLQRGWDTTGWGVRAVLPTSEVLIDQQRSAMAEAFGAPVVNEYGCGEVQAIAYECPHGLMHVTHENLVLELTDADGNPVPDGVPGLVTLTSLWNRATPLLRYQNGDLAIWSEVTRCECGRQPGAKLLKAVTGRTSDQLFATDGRPSHWTVIYYAIKDTLGSGTVDEHQAIQTAFDHLIVKVVRGENFSNENMEAFRNQLKLHLGENMRISIQFVDTISRGKTGKFRYFVSEIEQNTQD